MLSNLTGWHFVVILFIVLLLFGAPKLPGLARSLGQSMKIFKSEIRTEPAAAEPDAASATAAPSTSPAAAAPTAPVSSSAPVASAASPSIKTTP